MHHLLLNEAITEGRRERWCGFFVKHSEARTLRKSFALIADGQSSPITMVDTPSSMITQTGWQMTCSSQQMLKHLNFAHGSHSGNFGRITVGTYVSVAHVMIHTASAPSTATSSGKKKLGRR
jgi:hypothetical protein